ncbi:MAG: ABC transporter substrate-binding protein [Chloroflexi bacterium]|nr:MAG: ABC transporter substrate-binding protein [Chloroflexota bacterium]
MGGVRGSRIAAVSLLALLLVFGSLFVALGGSDANDRTTVDLGVVLSLSGPASIYGLSSQKGLELALAEINEGNAVPGVTIVPTVRDDGGSADTAAALFQELLDAGVDVVAGPTLSNSAVVADPVAAAAGLPVLAISNTATGITSIGDTIFRIPVADERVVPFVVATAVESLNLHTAALLWANDEAYATSAAEVMRRAAAEHGLEITIEQQFSTNDTDFSAALRAVQQAAPDALLIAALTDATIAVVTQAREMGLDQHIICGNSCNPPAFLAGAGAAAEGLLVGATWNSAVMRGNSAAFIAAFRARFNHDPDQFAAQAYTAMYVLADAARRAASSEPADLVAALAATRDVPSPLGDFSFDAQREPAIDPVVQVVRDGAFTVLDAEN